MLGAFAVGEGWGPAVSVLYKCRQDASALGAFIIPARGGSRDTAAERSMIAVTTADPTRELCSGWSVHPWPCALVPNRRHLLRKANGCEHVTYMGEAE